MRKLLSAGLAVASLTGIAYAQVGQRADESWAEALSAKNRPTASFIHPVRPNAPWVCATKRMPVTNMSPRPQPTTRSNRSNHARDQPGEGNADARASAVRGPKPRMAASTWRETSEEYRFMDGTFGTGAGAPKIRGEFKI